jgi:hypothetical protein
MTAHVDRDRFQPDAARLLRLAQVQGESKFCFKSSASWTRTRSKFTG